MFLLVGWRVSMMLLAGWSVRMCSCWLAGGCGCVLVGWLEGEDVFLLVDWRVGMCCCWLTGG